MTHATARPLEDICYEFDDIICINHYTGWYGGDMKNWAKVIKRVIMTDHTETIQAPIMDTTEESLKVVVGEDNVQVTAANAQHGKIVKANLSDGNLPEPEAFLFLMKDGDDIIMIGCTNGQVTAVDNVTFAPGSAINWNVTVTATGDDGFKLIMGTE